MAITSWSRPVQVSDQCVMPSTHVLIAVNCVYCRWGPIGDELDNAKEWERPPTWKERYMERDTLELQEVCGSVSELMRPFYAQVRAAGVI